MRKILFGLAFAAIFAVILISGCIQQPPPVDNQNCTITNSDIKTFKCTADSVETIDGKPVIRLFSTTWCPHCIWIKPTFDRVAKEYADAGKIVAYHWELDTEDNTLTPEVETSVPQSEQAVFQRFNPNQSIPTFVFGGKYYRIGTGYERENDLSLEEKEFRAVIDELIKEAQA
jgi:thiol-disulfide isomerase/thioredoxin